VTPRAISSPLLTKIFQADEIDRLDEQDIGIPEKVGYRIRRRVKGPGHQLQNEQNDSGRKIGEFFE
jgi:hypothetical protein